MTRHHTKPMLGALNIYVNSGYENIYETERKLRDDNLVISPPVKKKGFGVKRSEARPFPL